MQAVAAGEFKIWVGIMNVPYIKVSLGPGLSSFGRAEKIEGHYGPQFTFHSQQQLTKAIITIISSSGSRTLIRGGGAIEQKFIHEFISSPVLQWRRQNFDSEEGDIQQKCTKQRILKNCKKFAQKFKNSQNYFRK